MDPDIEFLSKVNVTKRVSSPRQEGTVPTIRFFCTENCLMDDREHILPGSDPVMQFAFATKYIILVSFPMLDGIFPTKLFDENAKVTRFVNSEIEAGKLPVSLLPRNCKFTRDLIDPIESGMVPANCFVDSISLSIIEPEQLTPVHSQTGLSGALPVHCQPTDNSLFTISAADRSHIDASFPTVNSIWDSTHSCSKIRFRLSSLSPIMSEKTK